MKSFLFAFFTFCLMVCNAQETERKVKHSGNGDKEVYYVLKANNEVRHGTYEKKGNSRRTIGNYINGLKDGVWTEFYQGNKLRSRGAYQDDVRVGLWKFYNWEGELDQEYNFTTNELVWDQLLESLKERTFRIIKGSDTLASTLQRPPIYLTGKTRMQSALTKGSSIGPILLLTKPSGNVIVGFVIDTAGKTRDHRVLVGVNPACDKEALRMVKQLANNWLPGLLNGQPVDVEHTITIAFKS